MSGFRFVIHIPIPKVPMMKSRDKKVVKGEKRECEREKP